MGGTRFVLSLVIAITCQLGWAKASNHDRRAASKQAEKTLLELHFFYDNRGMMAPPGFPPVSFESGAGWLALKKAANFLSREFGLIVHNDKVVGFNEVRVEGHRLGAIGCVMCHGGKAAGRFYPGLGNKNIDVYWLSNRAQHYAPYWDSLEKARDWIWGNSPLREELRANAMYFIKKVGSEEYANRSQGLVSIANVRQWFFEQANIPNDSPSPGQVKVPAFWGYSEKRKVGSFADGAGNGVLPGWAILVELVAGQKWQNIHHYVDKIEHAEDVIGDLLPPKYPFAIDQNKAAAGKRLFENRCATCHGTYRFDGEGLPIFEQPKFVPWSTVQTDYGRLSGVTEMFRHVVAVNPLNDLVQATELRDGYIAPRLNGIWARFPYLHNASVPTLYHVLSNPESRPKVFSLRRAGEADRFDMINVGLNRDPEYSQRALERLAKSGTRWVYDTSRIEHGNGGHSWPGITQDLTDIERFQIIEYLKTL